MLDLFSEAYATGKKEKPLLPESDQPSSSSSEDPVPDALLCLICKDLLTDAGMIPCCRSSCCDECECLFQQTSVRNKQAVYDKTNTISWSQVSERVCWRPMDMFVPPADSPMFLLML